MMMVGLREHFRTVNLHVNVDLKMAAEIEKIVRLKGVTQREFLREAVSLYVEAFNQGWEDSKYKSRNKNL